MDHPQFSVMPSCHVVQQCDPSIHALLLIEELQTCLRDLENNSTRLVSQVTSLCVYFYSHMCCVLGFKYWTDLANPTEGFIT